MPRAKRKSKSRRTSTSKRRSSGRRKSRSRRSRSGKRRRSTAAGQLLFAEEARRPLVALVFLLPVLLFYTAGLAWVRPDLAAGADRLIRQGLAKLALTGVAAPAFVVAVYLVMAHLVRRDPWRFSPLLPGAMWVETILLTVPLVALHGLVRELDAWLALGAGGEPGGGGWLAAVMTSIGAGIYEELIFRVVLVGSLLVVCRRVLKLKGNGAIVAGVLIFAALFAGAHTLVGTETFAWPAFLFRTAAGVYLSYLYAVRGFGIAAGVHIVHNVLAKILGA